MSSGICEDSMRDIIDPAWQQTEAPDWPMPAELDDLAVVWTDATLLVDGGCSLFRYES
jgi:hypothetical protein